MLLAIAWLFANEPRWWKFEVVFAIAFLASIMRIVTISRVTENPPHPDGAIRRSILSRIKEVFNEKRSEEIQASHAFFQESLQGVNNNCHMVFGHPRIKRKGDRTIANMFSHRKIA